MTYMHADMRCGLRLGLGLLLAALASTAQADEVKLSALPKLRNGVTAYPPPFLAVARTPEPIAPVPHPMHIQIDLGCLAGYSGFVDASTGQVGFPG